MTTTESKGWYIKKQGRVRGPYPGGLVTRYILLGRINRRDEISRDGIEWMTVSSCPELIPDALKLDPDDEFARQRLEAARRWADERETMHDDAGPGPEAGQALPADRKRKRYDEAVKKFRYHRLLNIFTTKMTPPDRVILISLSAGSYYLLTHLPPAQRVEKNECPAAPQPGINWENCQLSGLVHPEARLESARMRNVNLTGADLNHSALQQADLSYAIMSLIDLHGSDATRATLIGATLRGANLGGVNFSGSDLSYADLAGADITSASFDGASLGRAVWIDGTLCQPESVGTCLK